VELAAAREHMGWNHEPFVIPQDVYEGWDAKTRARPGKAVDKSSPNTPRCSRRSRRVHPPDERRTARRTGPPVASRAGHPRWKKAETVATRKASQLAIERAGLTRPSASAVPPT